jgi:hypothetical protein
VFRGLDEPVVVVVAAISLNDTDQNTILILPLV